MALRNKDGSLYTLRQPNPLVKEQEKWNSEKLVFHNTFGNSVLAKDEHHDFEEIKNQIFQEIKTERKPLPRTMPKFGVQVQQELQPSVVKEPESEPQKAEPVVDKPKPKKSVNKVVMYCLPMEMFEKVDDLYGDKYRKQGYGNKITIESIVVVRNDLGMQFWTNYPIAQGSIVYPYKYADGQPFGEHRWWKVERTEEVDGGVMVESMPSSYHPDFS